MIILRLKRHPSSKIVYRCTPRKVSLCGKLILTFNQVRRKRDNYRVAQSQCLYATAVASIDDKRRRESTLTLSSTSSGHVPKPVHAALPSLRD
jgi:hypothetical protein